jgi:hypothetical protein
MSPEELLKAVLSLDKECDKCSGGDIVIPGKSYDHCEDCDCGYVISEVGSALLKFLNRHLEVEYTDVCFATQNCVRNRRRVHPNWD